MAEFKRYEDIHVAFAKDGAPLKKEVAIAMGMRAETFSIHIRHKDAKVSPEWLERFNDAWEEVTNQKAAVSLWKASIRRKRLSDG